MASQFYNSIIEDEKKVFGIKDETLKCAARAVAKSYNKKSLEKGATFLDYNFPANRCAYLYKYATLHTGLVTKNFRKLLKKKEVRSILQKKQELQICCLGGGPGTDVVGLFKALAFHKQFHGKVVRVTVLDICGGWRNSFNRIVSKLKAGTVANVPSTFVNSSNFNAHLLAVDLLNPLPPNVSNIISNADIICMVKFVSAVLGNQNSLNALKNIGEKFKLGAAVLFIDNYQGSVSKPLEDISGTIGLQIALGPIHETFVRGSKVEKEIFSCLPQSAARVSVIGWIKCLANSVCEYNSLPLCSETDYDENDDEGWDTDTECDGSTPVSCSSMEIKPTINTRFDAFTQTETKCFTGNLEDPLVPYEREDLVALVTTLDRLLKLLNALNIDTGTYM